MIEQVARALAQAIGLAFEDFPDDASQSRFARHEHFGMSQELLKELARAAIKAMREPTIGMIGAGHNDLERALSENAKQTIYIGIPVIKTMWPAMIDAALSPERGKVEA